MKKKQKNLVIFIFPYLFTYDKGGIAIDGLTIKPSYTENINKEKEIVKKQLLNIAKLFRFGRNQQIYQWSYGFDYLSNSTQWENLKNKLNKFSTILRFSQLRDLKEHSKFENFNYFVFEITKFQLDKNDDPLYYQGVLNGESSISFYLNKNSVQNPYIPRTELNPTILTKQDIDNNDYFKKFYYYGNIALGNDEENKFLHSMSWFNRSYSHYGRGVDLSEAFLNVHIAIEALLRPEDEERGIKAQIKTALLNILGHSRQLSMWLDKSWKLRNSIVHGDQKAESLLYIHPEGKKGHRHHLYIARKIFVKCLDIIFKIRMEFPLLGLEDELISNEVRIEKAIKILKKNKTVDLKRVYESEALRLISGLRNDDISASKNKTKQLGELFLPYIKEDINSEEQESRKNLRDRIDKLLNWHGNNLGDLALQYSELQKPYDSVYFKEKLDLSSLALRGAAYNFLSFTTWRLLTMYE